MDSRSLKLVLLLCLLMFHSGLTISIPFPSLTQSHAHVYALPIRKMMMMKEGVEEMKKDLGVHEELRNVPSGPDPLHHHVNPPRQPRNQSPLP